MTMRIDFYTKVREPAQFACRLAQTVYNRGERLLVWLKSDEAQMAFSTRLWSFDDVAFVPHCRCDALEAGTTPIWLAVELPQGASPTVLLNLSDGAPSEAERFERILEIVGTDEISLTAARQRFKMYRERGCAIEHHDMSSR